MKRLLFAVSLALLLVLTACTRTATRTIEFPAYELENPKNEPYLDEMNRTERFSLQVEFPESWTLQTSKGEESVPMGDFYTPLYIYENEKLIGYIGFNRFEPYQNEDEIPAGDYYKTVYPGLCLSSMFMWDPYTPVAATETGETGIAQVWYKDPGEIESSPNKSMAEISANETLGILSYDKALKAYIGIAFCPGAVDQKKVETIAKSLRLAKA